MRIDRRLLGWGAFLVIAGAVPLAIRAGIVQRDLVEGWPALWPLLLVGAGLGLILRGTPVHILGGAISTATAGVMLGGLLATGFAGFPTFGACGTGSGGNAFGDRTGTLTDGGSMSIEFNCGVLHVRALDGDAWTFSGRGPTNRAPTVNQTLDGVRLSTPNETGFMVGDASSTWDVGVPRAPSVGVTVTLNAGDGTIDLTGATVGSTNLTVNAGSLKVNLAAAAKATNVHATVNAGSASISLPAALEVANLSMNAGSMTVCIPADAKIRVAWSGGLASNNLDSLGYVKLGENAWASPGVDYTSTATDLDVSANAGSFTLVIGGSCDA